MTDKPLSDAELLDLVQSQTLKYFWDFGHPVSGMARERSTGSYHYDPEHTVTTGGTGFGIMAMIAGAERGFIAKDDVAQRVEKIVSFLEKADQFHGAFSHFMDGRTGKVIPFSEKDDGGDLVETSFLMMGLLTARQYFKDTHPALAVRINTMWEKVEWDKYMRPDNNKLMWHWSPNHPWSDNNLGIMGWNECLITHVLAASSPIHGTGRKAYEASWLTGVEFKNGNTYHERELPLGPEKGGPLFFTHYSFLGLDRAG
ncbi:MAG: DUF3131 domain-containing protein [Alphaproteobacteria bacterium]|nr:DUF3131 domain-containing protein [Alphaproteobacteria bacterium]